jgi:hypothetical protein
VAPRLTIKDTGRINAPSAVKFALTVGIHEDEAKVVGEYRDSQGAGALTVGTVAEIHEFGSEAANVPARSWLRGWSDEKGDTVRAQIAASLEKMARTQEWSGPGGLAKVARDARNSLVSRIGQGIAPGLAESTLAKKAPKVVPLIDSRQMVDSISAQIHTEAGTGDSRGRRIGWDYVARGGAKKGVP